MPERQKIKSFVKYGEQIWYTLIRKKSFWAWCSRYIFYRNFILIFVFAILVAQAIF